MARSAASSPAPPAPPSCPGSCESRRATRSASSRTLSCSLLLIKTPSVPGLQSLVLAFGPRSGARRRLVFEEVDSVDDADDGRVDGRALLARGRRRGAPALLHDEHDVADPGVHRVEREQCRAPLLARGRDRLAEHHARVPVALVLLRRHDVAEHARQDHVRLPFDTWPSESTMPTMVQSVGVSSRRKGKLASLPLHQKTSSPTPAPMASSATSGCPCGPKSALSDCTTR